MSTLAHVGGLPLEETILQLAPAALAAVMALRLTAERTRRRASRLARVATRRRQARESPRQPSR